jgi:ABC-type dipeptide/oligopeptide/nickel transport system permease component
MIRHVLQRLLVAMIRFAAAALGVLLLMEFALVVLAGAKIHVWDPAAYETVPAELSPRPVGWSGLLRERGSATGRILLLAVPGVLLVGYSWGILGARLRRQRAATLLAAPFAAIACIPGFWFVGLVAIYSYFHWQRPGFANDLVVERGPDLLAWWHAAVVAVPALAAGAAWQIRSVAAVLEREVSQPWVRGAFVAGANDEEIFYRRTLRRSRGALLALSDRTLPALLGGLVVLEPAFRYPGIGSLLVESIRLGSYPGILLASLVLTALTTVAVFLREVLAPDESSA